MRVDPGFAHAVRCHVEEDGPLIVEVAKVGDPALWDTLAPSEAVKQMMMKGTLHAARERSKEQARAFLLAGAKQPPVELDPLQADAEAGTI